MKIKNYITDIIFIKEYNFFLIKFEGNIYVKVSRIELVSILNKKGI